MAQSGTNAKIEDLQFRIKNDPKSRLFFPLAEELRKHGKLPEAENVLRTGLGVHSTYLSGWVSLGRVLREQHKNKEAVEALTTALQVDPGNVVAARLLADAYFDLGEKVEAIKKYKLVQALMPADEELEARIEQLDRDLHGPSPSPAPVAPVALAPESSTAPEVESPFAPEPESPFASELESPFADAEVEHRPEPEPAFAAISDEPFAAPPANSFDETASMKPDASPPQIPVTQTIETPFDTNDAVPPTMQHAESPFEEPVAERVVAPEHEPHDTTSTEAAPLAAGLAAATSEVPPAERAEAFFEGEPAADVFAPAEPEVQVSAPADDVTATTTMADLYARQGLVDDARRIYEHMLQRDPSDNEVRGKLDALDRAQPSVQETPVVQISEQETEPPAGNPKVVVLQRLLVKLGRREEGSA